MNMKNFVCLKDIYDPDYITNYYEFSENDKLGEGHYGQVYKAIRKDTNTECALKLIDKNSLDEYE